MIALALLWLGGALAMAGVMSAAWLVHHRTAQSGWIDAFWSLGLGATGVGLALFPLDGAAPSPRQWIVAALVGLWGLRLGLHIARRAAHGEDDPRYAKLKQQWGDEAGRRLFGFLMIQAAAGATLAISVLMAARNPAEGPFPGGLGALDLVAVAVLAFAVLGEGLADRQLAAFKADPANKGQVCDTGLWAWSRHPNYFFEWLAWCAYPLFAFDPARPWMSLLALAGPVGIYLLLTRASGVPPLERHMAESRPRAWKAYVAKVPSAFWLKPPR